MLKLLLIALGCFLVAIMCYNMRVGYDEKENRYYLDTDMVIAARIFATAGVILCVVFCVL